MATLELFGTASCPHTSEMREWLEFRGCDFVEYDVEQDRAAFSRMRELSGGQRMVPTLVEDGKLADFFMVAPCDYIPHIQEIQASVYHVIRQNLEVIEHGNA